MSAVTNLPKVQREKLLAAEAAATLVQSGMTIGLGTGSTVVFLLRILARRQLSIRCVASSPRTEKVARELGLHVEPFDRLERLDLAIDGADQIAPDGWLVKGGGAALTREKIVAAAADRFVVIADSRKLVPALHGPVPVELLAFGLQATLRQLQPIRVRDVPLSPDGGVIADYQAAFTGPATNPATLAKWLETNPGLISHGLFPPSLVSEAFVARGEAVDRLLF
jgi:ribose 5-phosphate isomerase A